MVALTRRKASRVAVLTPCWPEPYRDHTTGHRQVRHSLRLSVEKAIEFAIDF